MTTEAKKLDIAARAFREIGSLAEVPGPVGAGMIQQVAHEAVANIETDDERLVDALHMGRL